ncbi:hypothetical protein B1748_19575 [Paenibacillus sp. MY03]|uniref:MFS transporter n=1 Tax=Paenibacillus sp. MY03 TaxID=302980 RepID=UPI000B3C152C|nr:MFS transporter [Paenibacillus sp. MY03]OUS74981.1 hypothetical protein B1748_19575 [Paenibacillus sp. MY03]
MISNSIASNPKQRSALFFSILCCLVYFTSYLTRINYGAALLEIAQSLNISNQLAGMAVIGSFITYGAGQPICGYLSDRFEPRTMIFAGLVATAFCNFAIAFMSDIYLMTFIWCLNGFFQAMLWPPLVRGMSQYLSPELYRKTSVGIVTASSAGMIVVYVLVPFSIWISGWRLSFVIPGIVAILVAFLWIFSIEAFGQQEKNEQVSKPVSRGRKYGAERSVGSLIWTSGLLPVMLVIILQGALRDGITTWMPTYIHDVFRLNTSISILSTVVLPLFTIVCVVATSRMYKSVKNELSVSALLWGAGVMTSLALICFFASHAMFSILLMALLAGCTHGINLMLISQLPLHYAKYGRAATISGILNAFTYIGSAISIYGIAALSEAYGWRFTIISWTFIALIGLIVCLGRIKKWRLFLEKKELEFSS